MTKSFGGVQALDGATIEVEEGSIAGLIGPNGSGKTTLFNVITGYERWTPARSTWATSGSPTRRRNKVFSAGIGRTFQLTRIFPRLTVMENMLVAAQHADRAGGRLATRWPGRAGPPTGGAPWSCWSSPASPDHAGALAETLSYGQRKLLELSYVLMADPAIVLLDEPAGGVNPTLITTSRTGSGS